MASRPVQSESEVTDSINALLDRLGIFHFKFHVAKNYMGRKGVSDIHAIYKGRAVWIEAKHEGWTPPNPTNSKAFKHYQDQLDFINDVKRANGLAGFSTCVNDAISILGVHEIIPEKRNDPTKERVKEAPMH